MKRQMKLGMIALAMATIGLSGCSKDHYDYENREIVEDSFTGNISVTPPGEDAEGDFTGDGDSGTFSFAWINPQEIASANFDVTTSGGGTVQLIINDAEGVEVLNKTRPNAGEDTFSGVTAKGTAGTWLITLKLNNLDGDGSYSIHPGD